METKLDEEPFNILKPVFYQGDTWRHIKKYSNTLAIFMLKLVNLMSTVTTYK